MSQNTLNLPRTSGILLHPTSLPNSPFCGSFGSPSREWLKLLAKNQIGVWQFLPIAPTDSTGSPYSSPSSFAYNPCFLDVNDLVEEGYLPLSVLQEISKLTSKENSHFDFKLVNNFSNQLGYFLREYWEHQHEEKHIEFEAWCLKQYWLEDHVLFIELRKQFQNLPWWEWPEPFFKKNMNEINTWRKNFETNLLEHRLIQWHLDRQWQALRLMAKELGVLLLGDLPFYVSRDSADVWSNRSLFSILTNGDLSLQSGVPPDYFSETGQLWGTPVYRWKKHSSSRFRWWRRRFKRHFEQVDLLRIDHFRALDSYWAVPGKKETAQDGFWKPSPGRQLLRKLQNDFGEKLPLIAEDLGVITPSVERLRDYFYLPGMKILQFAFDGNKDNPYLPENIHGNSWIVYTGTHDNATTKGWWNELDQDTKNRLLEIDQTIGESTSWKFIKMGLSTSASLFIAPIQDLLSLDNNARFNTPGTIKDNWSWRMPTFDENLFEALSKYRDLSISCNRLFKDAKKLL
tara:strand:- start:13993 stop:15534 length:1542 start_codon:yes stop_codon:yes gene_type:complete